MHPGTGSRQCRVQTKPAICFMSNPYGLVHVSKAWCLSDPVHRAVPTELQAHAKTEELILGTWHCTPRVCHFDWVHHQRKIWLARSISGHGHPQEMMPTQVDRNPQWSSQMQPVESPADPRPAMAARNICRSWRRLCTSVPLKFTSSQQGKSC